MDTYKLLVTSSEVGIIVEAALDGASTEIRRAREILGRLGAAQRTKTQSTPIPRAKARSLSERILILGADFFSQPREASEICRHLGQSGFHYQPVRVRDELLRMVKRGQLRRIGDGTKSNPYKYVNT